MCVLFSASAKAGEVIVKLRPGRSLRTARFLAAAHGLNIKREFATLSTLRGAPYCVISSPAHTTEQLLTLLRSRSDVEYAEPVYRRKILWPARPNDTYFDQLWALESTGQTVNGSTSVPGVDVGWFEAFSLSRIATGTVAVGVIDTGVDYTHADLAAAMWFNALEIPTNGADDDDNGYTDDYFGYDFAGDFGGPPDSDPLDIDESLGHGTHVSGTIGAVLNNGFGVCGYHPAIRIMALKASDDGNEIPTDASIAAIEYAVMMKTSGWNVVALNASYGGSSYSAIERDAIAAAGAVGIIFCAAAGNDGSNNDTYPQYPANYPCSNIISVAASRLNDTLANFSNYGSNTVHLAAPGRQIYSSVPTYFTTHAELIAPGSNIPASRLTYAGRTTGLTGTLHACGLGYATSFPPAVAGNIALIERGVLYFSEKVSNAMAAGAAGAVIYNNTNGNFNGTLQTPGPWIPAISIGQSDGQWLLSQGTQTVVLINRPDPTNSFAFSEGTSMATPQVAGAIAVLALSYPDENVTQRIARLLANVHVTNAFVGKVRSNGRLHLAHALDTDHDGLPDWWELQYVSSLSILSGTNDYDGDGYTEREEYWADTVPTSSVSFLSAALDSTTSGPPLIIHWPAAAQRTYSIESVSDLAHSWVPLATNVPAVPPVNVFTAAPSGSIQFYRVWLE
jgi:subtilisin family serine protease